MVNFEDILIPLDSAGRSGRAPDYQLEAQAHRELSKALSERPDDALQKLADTIVQLGVAQSAGISILDDADNRFHWPAIAGAWAKFLGGSMPYDASPCGVVVARNASLLFRDPQLAFPDAAVDPLIREILLSPLRVHGRTIGTVWALYHDDGRHFDAEHARLLESLAHLAGSAHWLASSLTRVAAERDRSAAQAAELARNRVELEESESRFRNMADHAPVMMWVTDVHGRCTYLNRCWYEFTGQSEAEALGFGWLDAAHPDDREAAERIFLEANAARSSIRIEYRLRHHDGSYRWAIDAASPRFGPDGAFLGHVGSVIDIEERRRAEDRLKRSEEQLRLAIEAADVGLWDVDIGNDRLFWPPRVKAMFGISADVPISMRDFYAGLHPDDLETTSAAFAAACDPQSRALYDVEYRTIGKEDGVLRWVAAKGRGLFADDNRCVRVIGTAIDITVRKSIEQALHDLNETLEQRVAQALAEKKVFADVVESSPAAVTALDLDYRILAINRANVDAFERAYGKRPQVGSHFLALFEGWPEHLEQQRAIWSRALAGETFEIVDQFGDAVHEQRCYEVRFSPLTNSRGERIGAASTCYDVTERVAAELKLAAAQEQLRQAQKMEAMGQLTGGVAHDFNNLLTPIIGSLDLLHRKGLGGEREQRLMTGAMQSAERARTLVQRLLAFARRQPLQPSAVDLASLVTGMAELIASTTGPQVRTTFDLAPGLPPAHADFNQLEMALLNLSVNARDAMPGGGQLTISARAESVHEGHHTALAPGHYVRLSVADVGCGMDEATRARAIEPFFSTKGVGKGTGLGLSMAHGLASQLGGALWLESEVGRGTEVQLWLPVSEDIIAVSPPRSGTPLEEGAGLVLVVDDEELVRISTADMLGELGYEVVEAQSAADALELIQGGLVPDLVVTDHLMPDMTGTELAEVLAGQGMTAPTLIVSGYAEGDGIPARFSRLAKPFRRDELGASIAALLG